MKHIIFIDEAYIGIFQFRCFIFEHRNQEIGFGIFLDKHPKALVWFEPEGESSASLHTNDELAQLISNQTQSNKDQRKENFRRFIKFIKDSERIAAKMVFKGREVEYLSKSKDIVKIKNDYINKVD
ncbi:hypothetical protein [Sphingobacterium yanglingense]|uniref:Uncharacterized protein n=1 Tax=Sphingobacterium yanglingense TaxID=1437280 RepID=A0A4R6W8Z5_9SPHI|nr:hypothetical protein [Sphingobacterium yanglingense]TDQ73539.1 hypothetical protein CLV99_4593 [Sphingobacterium yanglingense]